MRRVVVIGSGGFIGRSLVETLRLERVETLGFDSASLDLTRPASVDRLSGQLGPNDVLVVTVRSRHPQASYEGCVEEVAMAGNIAQCLERQRVARCVYFSSLSVYGDAATNLEITERTPISPTHPYGVAKFAAECLIGQVAARAEIPLVSLRPCKIYGPGDASGAYGPGRFLESILAGRKVALYGDGSELRDHIFSRDVVRIAIRLALGNETGVYNVATGRSVSFQDILALLARISGRHFEVEQVPRTLPKIDQRVDLAKLLQAMSDFRFTPLEEGLRETWRYFEARQPLGMRHG